jgi:type IV pilus assembly protein PilM
MIFKRKQCIGLDIGSSSVKVVQISQSKRGVQLLAFGVEPLSPQTIVDGTIMDQGAVVDAIRALWSRLRLRTKEVAIAISGHSVIIKKINNLSPMSRDELEEQIPYEAEHHLPFSRDDVEIDYEVVAQVNPAGFMEVLLVAAKKEIVHDYAAVVREAGLSPVVVDVAAFSAQNAFEINYDLSPGETAVLINVGAATSNINIIRDGVSLFTRDITIGGNSLTEEIQKQLGAPLEEAEAYKVGGAYDERGVVPQEVAPIIESVSEIMAGELQRSIDFYLENAGETNVSKICLAGGGAKVAALQRAIERRSRLPVEVVDAWRRVQIDPSLDAAYLAAHAPEAFVGLGLALRVPNDK